MIIDFETNFKMSFLIGFAFVENFIEKSKKNGFDHFSFPEFDSSQLVAQQMLHQGRKVKGRAREGRVLDPGPPVPAERDAAESVRVSGRRRHAAGVAVVTVFPEIRNPASTEKASQASDADADADADENRRPFGARSFQQFHLTTEATLDDDVAVDVIIVVVQTSATEHRRQRDEDLPQVRR